VRLLLFSNGSRNCGSVLQCTEVAQALSDVNYFIIEIQLSEVMENWFLTFLHFFGGLWVRQKDLNNLHFYSVGKTRIIMVN